MLPFIVFVGLTIINATEVKLEVIEKKGILAKNSTSFEIKPGWVGLVLGWVTTFKQKLFLLGPEAPSLKMLAFFFPSCRANDWFVAS